MSDQPSISRRLSNIVEYLLSGLADNARRINMPMPLATLISRRLMRLHQRLRVLIARGPLPIRPKPATPRNPRCETPAKPSTIEFYPPTGFAWLLRMFPGTAIAVARAQLLTLLDEPETQSLITSHPTLARSLRPLCHMVGLKPPACLKLPKKPRIKPAPKSTPQPPKPPKPAPQPQKTAKTAKIPRRIWHPPQPIFMTPTMAQLAARRFLNPRDFLP